MKHLFLDDDDLRHEVFAEEAKARGDESFHAHTMDEFIRMVEDHRPDVVWLDHDLNDFQYFSMGPNGSNGKHAAIYLVLLPAHLRPARVVIHSWNYNGGQRILEVLKDGGYTEIVVEQFSERKFWDKMIQWLGEGKEHQYVKWGLDPKTRLNAITSVSSPTANPNPEQENGQEADQSK